MSKHRTTKPKHKHMLIGVSLALVAGAYLLLRSNKRVIALERMQRQGILPMPNPMTAHHGGIAPQATTAAWDGHVVNAAGANPW